MVNFQVLAVFIIYFGMTMCQADSLCTEVTYQHCKTLHFAYVKEVKHFLANLGPIEDIGMHEDQVSTCTHASNSQKIQNNTCYSTSLLGSIGVQWKLMKTNESTCIKLKIDLNEDIDEHGKEIIEACCRMPRTPTPSVCKLCNIQTTRTSNVPPTSVSTTSVTTSNPASDTTLTVEANSDQSRVCKEQKQQTTNIVAASVLSFTAGVLATIFVLYARKRFLSRRAKDTAANTSIAQPEMLVVDNGMPTCHTDHKSYECLEKTDRSKLGTHSAGSCYLSLDNLSEDQKLPHALISLEDSKRTEKQEHLLLPNVYEQIKSVTTEENVYKVLKPEDRPTHYEEALDKESTEHTYNGLNNQTIEDEVQNDQAQPHDYFLLERENTDETEVPTDNCREGNNMGEDGKVATDQDFVILEENTANVNKDVNEDNGGYFTLEKV